MSPSTRTRVRSTLALAALVCSLASCGSSDGAAEGGARTPANTEGFNQLTFTNDTGGSVVLSRCSPTACGSPVWAVILEPEAAKEHVRVSNRGGFAAFEVQRHVPEAPGEGSIVGCFQFRFAKPVEKAIRVRISGTGPC